MTTCLHPNSVVANLNWAVPHFPIEDRTDRNVKSPIVGDPGLGLVARHLSDMLELKTGLSVDDNLQSVSEVFLGYSMKSGKEIFDLFKSERTKRLNEALTYLKVRLDSTSIHTRSWRKYLERGVEEMEVGIKDLELLSYKDGNADIAHHQKFALEFSLSLSAWRMIRHESKNFISSLY